MKEIRWLSWPLPRPLPREVALWVPDTGAILGISIHLAGTFGTRLRGLLFRPSLSPGEGLLLFPTRQVHSYLMRFPLDVAYIDRHGHVLRKEPLLPGRRGPYVRKAFFVLEMSLGALEDLEAGQRLALLAHPPAGEEEDRQNHSPASQA